MNPATGASTAVALSLTPPGAPLEAHAPRHAGTTPGNIDGILCFGGVDWWYHNRGHYDLQMMRELSAHVPVLYVNSIGMRLTSAGSRGRFLQRVRLKLASVSRGRVTVRPGMTVYSPFAPPLRFGRPLIRRALAWQVRHACRALGLRRPLIWVASPHAAEILDLLKPAVLVYQRTDRFEEYPGVDRARIVACDLALKSRADLTLFCSSLLLDEESAQCRRPLFVDHGVDFDLFAQAGVTSAVPASLQGVAAPRVGYIGNLEPHRVDQPMLGEIARLMPHVRFVIAGPGPLDPSVGTLANVHRLPQQAYEEVPKIMAACDVLIMPWNENAWIRACNPVKLKEYLAVGRPVITTTFEELRRYQGCVHVASGAGAFAAAIQSALDHPDDPVRLRNRVREETWAAKARSVFAALRESSG